MNLHALVVAKEGESVVSQYLAASRGRASNATVNFEALVRLYYLRHGYETSDTYMTHTLATLGFATLGRLARLSPDSTDSARSIEEARSTIFLTAKGLSDQGSNYYIPYTLFELLKQSLSGDDVRTLLRFINQQPSYGETASSRLRTDHVQAQYPVNIVDMTKHPEQKRLGNMIREFSTLALEAHSQTSPGVGGGE